MLFTIQELIDLVIMVFAIGYLFSSFIKREPTEGYDPLNYYKKSTLFEDIKYAIMIAAPAVVLHELGHKFMAMGFGATAILHAPLTWYALAIIMKLLNLPLFFFVGGYVAHSALPPLESALVSFSGPFVNLVLYLVCLIIVKFKLVKRKNYRTVGIAGRLNLLLFGFNMIPLPGFDGFNMFAALISFFFR